MEESSSTESHLCYGPAEEEGFVNSEGFKHGPEPHKADTDGFLDF